MKTKILWMALSCLMVVALVLASCKAPGPEVKVVEGKEMVNVSLTKTDGTVMEKWIERPQYGGQVNYHVTQRCG